MLCIADAFESFLHRQACVNHIVAIWTWADEGWLTGSLSDN